MAKKIKEIIAKGTKSYFRINQYPSVLHNKIIVKLNEDSRKVMGILGFPQVVLAAAVLFFVFFIGIKMVEKSDSFMYNKIPKAVILSLENQAELMSSEKNSAIEDTLKAAILDLGVKES